MTKDSDHCTWYGSSWCDECIGEREQLLEKSDKLYILLSIIKKLSQMMKHWKVPDLPEIYKMPMEELVEVAKELIKEYKEN